MPDTRAGRRMFSESLREAGVLILVFYGLGALLPQARPIGVQELVGAVLGGTLGIMMWLQGVRLGLEE
jgi:hypothetical protein